MGGFHPGQTGCLPGKGGFCSVADFTEMEPRDRHCLRTAVHCLWIPAKQEMRVQSLGREDPLEKEMTTRSRILAWRNPWTEEPDGQESDMP